MPQPTSEVGLPKRVCEGLAILCAIGGAFLFVVAFLPLLNPGFVEVQLGPIDYPSVGFVVVGLLGVLLMASGMVLSKVAFRKVE